MINGPLKLLAVDDEPDIELLFRQRFRRKVRKGEIELHFARDGVEALQTLREHPDIHIVLSDINMPGMDGLTLLAEIGKLEQTVEVVIVSAYGDLDNIRTAMNCGAYDFLTKPLDFADLDATVAKTILQVTSALKAEEARDLAAELKEKNAFIRHTFGRYVSDDVVGELLDHPEGLELGGERRPLTVLCSDLRGFTPMADRSSPEEVVQLLNRYFEAMFRVILDHGGTINAIMGDGLFVLFGAPITMPDAAQRAVSCAIEMQLALQALRDEEDFPALEMGIGIHSGAAVVGNIGSKQRTHYSAIGRDVNLAARVESCTVGGQILITAETLGQAQENVVIGDVIEVALKGVSRRLSLHEVEGLEGGASWVRPRPPLVSIGDGISVDFWVLAHKTVDAEASCGRLLRLSRQGCELAAEVDVPVMTDLRLRFVADSGDAPASHVYGKALRPDEEGRIRIGFTSMPPDVQAWIDEQIRGS